jgi:hypothetical protein
MTGPQRLTLEHFQAKRVRFAVESAIKNKAWSGFTCARHR